MLKQLGVAGCSFTCLFRSHLACSLTHKLRLHIFPCETHHTWFILLVLSVLYFGQSTLWHISICRELKCLAMLKSYNIYHVIGVRHCSLIKLCLVRDTNILKKSPFRLRMNGPKPKHHNWMLTFRLPVWTNCKMKFRKMRPEISILIKERLFFFMFSSECRILCQCSCCQPLQQSIVQPITSISTFIE